VGPDGLSSVLGPLSSVLGDGLEDSLRVDVGRLDRLMNLVGELVLARNQLLQFTAAGGDPAFLGTAQRLNQITTELQTGIMKTRMQPIGTLWNKLPRLARDLALACGKQVEIDLAGADTELDKAILEAIKGPLTHLVRNAIDHGIEAPEVRQARGKPAAGWLSLRAYHEGGLVHLEVADDGGGIDLARVRQNALASGALDAAQAAHLDEGGLLSLIFRPGLSTAAAVSHVSGRGVGLDVVKTNIEKLGGTVEVQSRPGRGTTFHVQIPLTLAIIPALIVTCAGDRYAIPQASLLELVRLEGEQARRGVEHVHGGAVYRLRDKLLPLADLDRQLRAAGTGPRRRPDVQVVVLQAGDRQFGLVVDGTQDTEEIVVKPLGRHLKGVPLFAGATILGDGKVVLILDVLGLARAAGVVADAGSRILAARARRARPRGAARQVLLLSADGRRLAVPLEQVARLEELPAAAAERAGRREVTQYRGRIVPLVRFGAAPAAGAAARLVVCGEPGRQVGLVVDRILDVAEAAAADSATRDEGTLGSAVIGGQVTDLLDLPALAGAAGGGRD
jgi:two-component system chemotaxis sensor kinase CheA